MTTCIPSPQNGLLLRISKLHIPIGVISCTEERQDQRLGTRQGCQHVSMANLETSWNISKRWKIRHHRAFCDQDWSQQVSTPSQIHPKVVPTHPGLTHPEIGSHSYLGQWGNGTTKCWHLNTRRCRGLEQNRCSSIMSLVLVAACCCRVHLLKASSISNVIKTALRASFWASCLIADKLGNPGLLECWISRSEGQGVQSQISGISGISELQML